MGNGRSSTNTRALSNLRQSLPSGRRLSSGDPRGTNSSDSAVGRRAIVGADGPLEAYEVQNRRFNDVYEMGVQLGAGSFSVVHCCRNKRDGRLFAVKCVNLDRLVPEDRAALNNEVLILNEISHPHIVQLVEVLREANMCYLVMELVGGGELFDRVVRRTSYPEQTARHLTRLLVSTVEYLHAHNVVHRDIKPENLLLVDPGDDCKVKIADFGFAEHISSLGEYSAVCGTPQYVAPEILQGHRYGATVDIWSLGVVTFVLLGGYPPFYDREKKELFRKIVRGSYEFHAPFWDHISQDAKDFIRCMLVLDARSRLTAKQLLEHRWLKGPGPERRLLTGTPEFRTYWATRRFRVAALTVMAANRFLHHSRLELAGSGPRSETPPAVAQPRPAAAPATPKASSTFGRGARQPQQQQQQQKQQQQRPVPMVREDAGVSWLAPLRVTDNVQLFRRK